MCSEVCSPRISFSYGIGQIESDSFMQIQQQQQIEYDNPDSSLISDPGADFEFISACFDYEISSADELFSNGMILPIQVHPKIAQNDLPKPTPRDNNNHSNNHKSQPLASSSLPPLPCSNNETTKKKAIKEITISTLEPPEEKSSNSSTCKSFWGFKRSSSLNSEGVQKRSLMCSFPLLARSNSTGSVPKKTSQKQQPSLALVKSSSSSSWSWSSVYSQKPPLKKGYGLHGSHYHGNNGVRVSPVLSVVPTHHLLGLGSFWRNGKDKKTKR